jgi:hypothetical protein
MREKAAAKKTAKREQRRLKEEAEARGETQLAREMRESLERRTAAAKKEFEGREARELEEWSVGLRAKRQAYLDTMTPEEHEQRKQDVVSELWSGGSKEALVCPHCQSRGTVTTKTKKVGKGVSGGKATAAILTVGVSLIGPGLSRNVKVTQLTCSKCHMSWSVDR